MKRFIMALLIVIVCAQPAQADALWMCTSDETELHPVLMLNVSPRWVTAFEKGGAQLWKTPFTTPQYMAKYKAHVRSHTVDDFVFMLIVTEEESVLFSVYQVSTETTITWNCQ